jgi:tetratricopeptide (TPR) repeat protein
MWLDKILSEQGEIDQIVELHRICRGRQIDNEILSVVLATILIEQGRIQEAADELRPHADSNPSGFARVLLADALDKIGAIDELRSRASDGDSFAAVVLYLSLSREVQERCKTLNENLEELGKLNEESDEILEAIREVGFDPEGDTDEVMRHIEEMPEDEFERVVTMVMEGIVQLSQRTDQFRRGIAQEEAMLLQNRAQMEEQERLAVLLPDVSGPTDRDEHPDPDGEIEALRSSPKSRENAWKLAGLLMNQDKHDEAFAVLRERVEAGDHSTALWLSELLAAHGRGEEALRLLQSRVAAGDPFAFIWLDYLLAERADADELAARVQAGDAVALERLIYVTADRLAEQGEHAKAFAALRRLADAGNRYMAFGEMAEWLTRHERPDEARRLERYGLTAEGAIADSPGAAMGTAGTGVS